MSKKVKCLDWSWVEDASELPRLDKDDAKLLNQGYTDLLLELVEDIINSLSIPDVSDVVVSTARVCGSWATKFGMVYATVDDELSSFSVSSNDHSFFAASLVEALRQFLNHRVNGKTCLTLYLESCDEW